MLVRTNSFSIRRNHKFLILIRLNFYILICSHLRETRTPRPRAVSGVVPSTIGAKPGAEAERACSRAEGQGFTLFFMLFILARLPVLTPFLYYWRGHESAKVEGRSARAFERFARAHAQF